MTEVVLSILVTIAGICVVVGFWHLNLKRGVVVGMVFIGLGIASAVVLGHKANMAADRQNRIVIVTGPVIKVNRAWEKSVGCILQFKLDNSPLAFEEKCASFIDDVNYSPSMEAVFFPPKQGDVVRVKFVRPEHKDGQPEVLEVYNLTQEIERVRSAAPSAEPPNTETLAPL